MQPPHILGKVSDKFFGQLSGIAEKRLVERINNVVRARACQI
jgi:hypothetical protein